jgi:twitching motility protein PilT
MVSTPAVGAIIREGATQKLYDVIIGGKAQGMQFMDEAIWARLRDGYITPMEAYMKSIDKNRFKAFLPPEDKALGDASGGEVDR